MSLHDKEMQILQQADLTYVSVMTLRVKWQG